MKCSTVKVGGVVAIVCSSRPKRRQCSVKGCNNPGTLLCDFWIAPQDTCDKALCVKHAVKVFSGADHCPDHPTRKRPLPAQGALALDESNKRGA